MTEQHITIGDITPRVRYVADGVINEFDFSFPIFKEEDINIYLNETLQSSGFTVTGVKNSEGGTIIFDNPPNNETIVTILRNLDIKRTTDFQEGGAFRANVINDELDYQTACLQELEDSVSRSLILPPYAADNVDMTLPASNPGKALLWNENGDGLENSVDDFNNIVSTISDSVDTAVSAKNEAVSAKDIAINATQNINFPTMIANTYLKAKSDASGYETKSIAEVTSDVNKKYIYGFSITYIDNATIQVGAGECLSGDNSTILKVNSNTNAVLSNATANTTYHLFLKADSSLEFSSDINAVSITGAKRRIFSIITDTNGNIYEFICNGENGKYEILYVNQPITILDINTSYTNISLAIPTTPNLSARIIFNQAANSGVELFVAKTDILPETLAFYAGIAYQLQERTYPVSNSVISIKSQATTFVATGTTTCGYTLEV